LEDFNAEKRNGRPKTAVAFEDYNTGEFHENTKMQDGLETLRTKSENGFCK
jgi:hypothetical protein